jgi:hypothetical protein
VTLAQAACVGESIVKRILERQIALSEKIIAELIAEERFQRKANMWFKRP